MSEPEPGQSAERLVFFSDAVIAIAMTLLILPLMESVTEARSTNATAGEWLAEQTGSLISFTISFVLTATFWGIHHRLFEHVEQLGHRLRVLNLAWLFSIVCLPVATAISTLHSPGVHTDPLQLALYIAPLVAGSAILGVLAMLMMRDRHTGASTDSCRRTAALCMALTVLYLVAFGIGALTPLGYFALFVLALTSPLMSVFRRLLERLDRSAGDSLDTATT